ncbi:PR domain zinc finger protein 16 [Rhizoctonia solani]|uniref:PR domain zinc finger protein 16 n=1 Tax=Rhizoctonia solani TaxID=456999 RepID=A0A0K6GBX5_9AGAM|nr:PR domain zinc finger protein 16 [Rhizoctonia solani]
MQPSGPVPFSGESSHGDGNEEHPVGGDVDENHCDEGEMDGEDGEYGDEGEEGGYDPDAEAEAMAQALGNQIWAELEQGIADGAPSTDNGIATEPVPPRLGDVQLTSKEDLGANQEAAAQLETSNPLPVSEASGLEPSVPFPHAPNAPTEPDPMIETIKTMLSLALSDPHVHYALMATIVPGPVANGANLYTILSNSVMEGRVNPELAQPLSILISALASGSMLVSSEHQYTHPASQDLAAQNSPLKRKRDSTDEGKPWPVHPPYNPSVQPAHASQSSRSQSSEDLLVRIRSATSGILQVLDPLLAIGQSLNQSVISSIQRQLHQVYSFVSTCPQQHEGTSGGGTLQEIGGLIQVIGILNEVPIAQAVDTTSSDVGSSGSGRTSVGTSIYPCATCPKAFSKLSLLRAHERTHSEGRPYRCEYAGCPASFARNHDLRRHEKSHERQMFRCGGCDRLFSRRDALRRHKANDKALDECREAPMDSSTVTHDGDPPRVTRVWQNHAESGDWPKESEFEEGEIQPDAIASARYIVGTLYQTLQRHVSKGLDTGGTPDQSDSQPLDPQPLDSHTPNPPTLSTGKQPELTESPSQPTLTSSIKEEITELVEGPGVSEISTDNFTDAKTVSTLPGYGLDDEHTSLLERAIAVAAQAAQAEAEAEAALYEEEYNEDDQDAGEWVDEGDENEQRVETGAAKLVC